MAPPTARLRCRDEPSLVAKANSSVVRQPKASYGWAMSVACQAMAVESCSVGRMDYERLGARLPGRLTGGSKSGLARSRHASTNSAASKRCSPEAVRAFGQVRCCAFRHCSPLSPGCRASVAQACDTLPYPHNRGRGREDPASSEAPLRPGARARTRPRERASQLLDRRVAAESGL